jgi:hypothetical protein
MDLLHSFSCYIEVKCIYVYMDFLAVHYIVLLQMFSSISCNFFFAVISYILQIQNLSL